MTTEELTQASPNLFAFDADEPAHANAPATEAAPAPTTGSGAEYFDRPLEELLRTDAAVPAAEELRDARASKKEHVIALYRAGTTDIAEIVRRTGVRPSYAAQVLQRAGLLTGYFDLYTTTGREMNVYGRFFRNVLQFKTVEAARASVDKIDKLYNYFERLGDRAGQHQSMVMALTGKNRARWSGKHEAAAVFSEWLAAH